MTRDTAAPAPKNLDSIKPQLDRIHELLSAAAHKHGVKQIVFDLDEDKTYKTLLNELSQQGTSKLGLKTAIKIMQLTGDLAPLDLIEALFNRVAFSLPENQTGAMAPLFLLVGKLTFEFGENMSLLGYAMQDGQITKSEARACLKELADVLKALLQLRAYLVQVQRGGEL